MTDFYSLSAIFCSLPVLISHLGYGPSFFGHFSHDVIIVAPSLRFINVLKSSSLVLFSWRKTQKGRKKLANGRTPEHNLNRSRELQCRATTFVLLLFWETGHVTTLLTAHWMMYHWFLPSFGHPHITMNKYNPLVFFLEFSAILLPFLIWKKYGLPYLESHPGPWK